MKLVAVLLSVILITNGLAGCSSLDIKQLTSQKINPLDEQEERRFAEKQFARMKLKRANPKKMKYVNKILCEISRTAGLKKCVYAYYIETKGGYSSPSAIVNTIVIPSSILSLKKENIYFVLAHEVSHIALGHTKKRSKYDLGNVVETGLKTHEKYTLYDEKNQKKLLAEMDKLNDFVGLLAIPYIAASFVFIIPAEIAAHAFNAGYFYAFSKRQEYQADISAMYIMKKKHISTVGTIGFLETLADLYDKEKGSLLGVTHPLLKDRIKNIKKNGGKPVNQYIDDESLTEVGNLFLLLKLFGF